MMQSVPTQSTQGNPMALFIFFFKSKSAVKSLQCNLHFQSHPNTQTKVFSESHQIFLFLCAFSEDQYEHENFGPRNQMRQV